MADFLRHEPCPNCGSRDALARYADGSAHCFTKCGYNEKGDGEISEVQEVTPKDWTPVEGEYRSLAKRGISKETCEFWKYQVTDESHVMNYRDAKGALVAQKFRKAGKQFSWIGKAKSPPLYGMWLWGGGKHLVITEGELDALSMSQAFDLKWPVVSLPNGAQSATAAIAQHYEWLSQFDRIVLMFDMDDPGREAAEAAAAALPAGRACIAALPEKDANDTLIKHGPGALVKAFWNAALWRPDGIRAASELAEEFFNPPPVRGIPYPWEDWNNVLGMMRLESLVTMTAGTGIGKSTTLKELLYHALVTNGEPCGAMFLEENNLETMESLVGIHLSKNVYMDRALATEEELKSAFETVSSKPLYVYDHFGSSEIDNICAKIRYLVKACGVRWVFLDHLSILVSGLEGDERRTLDMAMTKLRTLVSELKCGLFCVVHLKRPEGNQGHEDGADIHLGQLRGSHAIAQLSDAVIALQKPEDDPNGYDVMPICLKNRRNGGRKGPMGKLRYDRERGRLVVATPFDDADDDKESVKEL